MSRRAILGTCAFLVMLLPLTGYSAPATPGDGLRRARQALTESRVEDAAKILDEMRATQADHADFLYLDGLLAFHRGEYDRAATAMRASLEKSPSNDGERPMMRALVESTHEATRHFERVTSKDGRFVILHAKGPDALLVPYAFDALAAIDAALEEELGYRMPGPVRLEIYPTAAGLAEVSTLSLEAIERTGTIALCKWDRLMVTSPRALLRGYPWVDTIAHEYVHLVLTRASRDRAPVWLQEGIAKYLERRWRHRDAPGNRLDPASEGLLTSALREDRLIPFERLHPSIALLPSQADAALAFAQVATFVESFHRAHGSDGLQRAIALVAKGVDAREALATVAKKPFTRLEATWREGLKARLSPKNEAPRLIKRRLRKGETPDESLDVEGERTRRYVRLGDLLYSRGRAGAAKVEYGKALRTAPDDPVVASRVARAALASGDPDRAADAIAPIVARYPEHAPAHAAYASALLAQRKLPEAREAAWEAIRLNPFDPEPHCALVVASADENERRREREMCATLGGQPPAPDPVRR